MTLAGGCANKNLVRVGGGSLRSLVVLVFMAIAGYMTLKGLFGAVARGWLDPVAINLGNAGWTDQSLGTALAHASGLDARTALWAAAGAIALALAAFAFKDRRFRGNLLQWLGGIVLGLLSSAAGTSAATSATARTRKRSRGVLRDQHAHPRVAELRRARRPSRWSC
jgi:hypothetical protein